jgi:RNA polymerase sigma factor (sigma-70 family)
MDLVSASGDSFERLCVGFRRELFNHAKRLTRDADVAEDIVQDALVRAWKAWPRWTPGTAEPLAAARAWLYAITTNVFLNHVESRRLRGNAWVDRIDEIVENTHGGEVQALPAKATPQGGGDAGLHGNRRDSWDHAHGRFQAPGIPARQDAACDDLVADEVLFAIQRLRQPWRKWLELYYFEGLDSVEIAAAEGTSPETVTSGLHRSREFLRPLLKSFAAANYGLARGPRVDVASKAAEVVKSKPRRVQRVMRQNDAVALLAS